MKKNILLILSLINFSVYGFTCEPWTKVNPIITSKVDFDASTKLYYYQYTVSNDAEAAQSIVMIILKLNAVDEIVNYETPDKVWVGEKFRNGSIWWQTSIYEQYMDYIPNLIDPGKTLSGFGFKSPHPPGTVEVYVSGNGELPKVEDDGEIPLVKEACPEFAGDIFDNAVMGKTIGPVVAASNLSVGINIKPMSVEPVPFNPKAKGVLPVAVLGTENLKGSDIDVSSVVFGPKEIKALKNSLEDVNKDGHEDLVLHFKSDEAGIRCGPDLAVFLKGKLKDGRAFQGGQAITPVGCGSNEKKDKIDKHDKNGKKNKK